MKILFENRTSGEYNNHTPVTWNKGQQIEQQSRVTYYDSDIIPEKEHKKSAMMRLQWIARSAEKEWTSKAIAGQRGLAGTSYSTRRS